MEWLSKLKKYAPDVAMAIATGGATLPQLAIKAVADAVGDESIKDESSLGAYITKADPATLLKITQANNTFKIQMRQLDVELESSELKDIQHAREQHNHSHMPAAITFVLTALMSWVLNSLMSSAIPSGNEDILFILFGQVSALWGASIVYWVGTTRGSSMKTIMMGLGKK